MPATLDTVGLANALLAAFDKASLDNGVTVQQRRQTAATEIAAAIEIFVKSGTVSVTVTTTGTATNHTGTGTGNVS